MSKDKIEVNMNIYDIPIVVEQLEKANKEIEQLNNIINNIIVELEILLQSEDFELITMQLRNIVFRLKGVDKE